MAHLLDGVREKLARAEEHLATIKNEVRAYLGVSPDRVGDDPKPKDAFAWLVISEGMPLRLSILIGEYLYNLRCALDYLVNALREANGKQPSKKAGFPIFLTEAGYREGALKPIKGVSPQAKTIIETLQPYHDGARANRHPLWFVHEFSNTDKHRALVLMRGIVGGLAFRYSHGAEGAQTPPSAQSTARTNVQMKPHDAQSVTLAEPGPWRQEPVTVLLESALEFIRQRVLPRFEPFFDQRP